MKIFGVFLLFLFAGMIALYVWIGRMGSENLEQDRLLSLQMNARQALDMKRPDLALKYYDKGLQILQRQHLPEQEAVFFSGRGDALQGLHRCAEAQQAWRRACQSGNKADCQRQCVGKER